jgi:hypothetical protein
MALIPIFFSYNQKHIENMLNFGNCATINSSRNQKNVFRYIMTYYNRERIYIANPGRSCSRYVPSGRQRPGRLTS